MLKPNKLNKGDKIAIVSLSSGILGEEYCKHQLDLGVKRIKELGFIPVFMDNTLKGNEYIFNNPDSRAKDLKQAFFDDEIKGIIASIGGDDTFKTIPYLLEDQEFINQVKKSPKLFMGYSDTTNNHFMFYKLGITTYYGLSFIVDFAELDNEMLSYTKKSFLDVLENKESYEIKSSEHWYEERMDFSKNAIGTSRVKHIEKNGYMVLRGNGVETGTFFGGCLESLYDMLVGSRYCEQVDIYKKYELFLKVEDFKDKILFLETSEEQPNPQKYRMMLEKLSDYGIFKNIKALIVGKPQNEVFFYDYIDILLDVTEDYNTKILYNINFGHAHPKTIIGYGLLGLIDFDNKKIIVTEKYFKE